MKAKYRFLHYAAACLAVLAGNAEACILRVPLPPRIHHIFSAQGFAKNGILNTRQRDLLTIILPSNNAELWQVELLQDEPYRIRPLTPDEMLGVTGNDQGEDGLTTIELRQDGIETKGAVLHFGVLRPGEARLRISRGKAVYEGKIMVKALLKPDEYERIGTGGVHRPRPKC